jgi:hypothetical protein
VVLLLLFLLLFLSIHGQVVIRLFARFSRSCSSPLLYRHESTGMLHFKYGVLTEVDEGFQFFLITALGYDGVEERPLRFLESQGK